MSMKNQLTYCKDVPLSEAQKEFGASFSVEPKRATDVIATAQNWQGIVFPIDPEEVIRKVAGTEFNFQEMIDACKIFPDFDTPVVVNEKNRFVGFTADMLFQVGPDARKVKKTDGDKTWWFIFPTNKGHVSLYAKTHKENNVYTPLYKNDMVELSIRHASLVALTHFEKLVKVACEKDDIILLTPLAGAIYSKEGVRSIWNDVKHLPEFAKLWMVINAINASCQSGGCYMESSRLDLAIIATIVALRNVKDKAVRDSIYIKTIKQYSSRKKPYDEFVFEQFAARATGGIPDGMDWKTMHKQFEDAQKHHVEKKLNMKQMKAMVEASKTPMGTVQNPLTPKTPEFSLDDIGETKKAAIKDERKKKDEEVTVEPVIITDPFNKQEVGVPETELIPKKLQHLSYIDLYNYVRDFGIKREKADLNEIMSNTTDYMFNNVLDVCSVLKVVILKNFNSLNKAHSKVKLDIDRMTFGDASGEFANRAFFFLHNEEKYVLFRHPLLTQESMATVINPIDEYVLYSKTMVGMTILWSLAIAYGLFTISKE